MANVMISLPDDLLASIDATAKQQGTTRSGYLQQLAEEEIERRRLRFRERMAEINRMEGALRPHGGNVAELVKANRPR